jgi:hypothetical protein
MSSCLKKSDVPLQSNSSILASTQAAWLGSMVIVFVTTCVPGGFRFRPARVRAPPCPSCPVILGRDSMRSVRRRKANRD